jgi:tRNA pseudouridine38-40 synthase
VARSYRYRLLHRDDLLAGRYGWWPRRAFAIDRLDAATRSLEGEADFTSFRSQGSGPSHPVCRMEWARWREEGDGACLDITADHFLYHMVRNIVGTALAAAESRDPAGRMREVLASRDRRRAGVTAPARGLCLERVRYAGEDATW